jgi:hypothetical protein
MVTLKDFEEAQNGRSDSPAAMRIHNAALEASKGQGGTAYMTARARLHAEALDRERPLPAILATDAHLDDRIKRDVAKTGKTYLECYAAVMAQQRELVAMVRRDAKVAAPVAGGHAAAASTQNSRTHKRTRLKAEHRGVVVAMNGMMRRVNAGSGAKASEIEAGMEAFEALTREIEQRRELRNVVFEHFADAYVRRDGPAIARASGSVLDFLSRINSDGPEAA